MSIEIANFVQAAFVLGADNPPVILGSVGLRATTPVTRVGAGNYRVFLAQEILGDLVTPDVQGFVLATVLQGGVNSVVSVEAQILDPNNDYVALALRDAAGLVQDGAIVQVGVYRLPTVA